MSDWWQLLQSIFHAVVLPITYVGLSDENNMSQGGMAPWSTKKSGPFLPAQYLQYGPRGPDTP